MEETNSTKELSFFARLGLAFKILFDGELALKADTALAPDESAKPALAEPPEKVHASALLLLSSLQREGRLIDFLQQDVTGFSDEDVGAAARVVHAGCGKLLQQYIELAPVRVETEGSPIAVPQGFDAQRIRLTGNVTGQPPFRGTLKHHGWVAKAIRLPALSESMDASVIAPAEVEL